MQKTVSSSPISFSPTRKFIHASRQRLKAKQHQATLLNSSPNGHLKSLDPFLAETEDWSEDQDIEIYISPPSKSSFCESMRTHMPFQTQSHIKPALCFVSIVVDETNVFVVPEEVARKIGIFRNMLNGGFKESMEKKVYLSNMKPEIVERVLMYCMEDHRLNNQNRIIARRILFPSDTASPRSEKLGRIEFSFEVPSSQVMELLFASHFLDIPDLLDVCCKMLAENIDRKDIGIMELLHSKPNRYGLTNEKNVTTGIETLKDIPEEVVQQIYSHIQPRKLCCIESPGKSPGSPPPNTSLWKKAMDKKGWHVRDQQQRIQFTWHSKFAEMVIPLEEFSHIDALEINLPSVNEPNWKQAFLEKDFQHLVDTYSCSTDSKEFVNYFDGCSKYISRLKIPPSFIDHLSTRNKRKPPKENQPQQKSREFCSVDKIYNLTPTHAGSDSKRYLTSPDGKFTIRSSPSLRSSATRRTSLFQSIPLSLCDIIGMLSQLQLLDLSYCSFEKFQNCFAELIEGLSSSCPLLVGLKVANAGIPIDACEAIGNYIGNEKSRLLTLDLSDNEFGTTGLSFIASALQQNKNLRCLSLASNNLGEEEKLEEIITKNSSTSSRNKPKTSLCEQRNNNATPKKQAQKCSEIGKSRAIETPSSILNRFFCAVARHPALVLVDLGWNRIEFSTIYFKTWKVFSRNAVIEVLLLNNNNMKAVQEIIGFDTAAGPDLNRKVCSLPSNLRFLDISGCCVPLNCVQNLVGFLAKNSSLTALNIADNLLGPDAMHHFADWLSSSNCLLQRLNVSGNNLRQIGARALATSISKNRSLIYLNASHNVMKQATMDLALAALGALPIPETVAENNTTTETGSEPAGDNTVVGNTTSNLIQTGFVSNSTTSRPTSPLPFIQRVQDSQLALIDLDFNQVPAEVFFQIRSLFLAQKTTKVILTS